MCCIEEVRERVMKRVVVPLLLAVLAGCASQPHTGDNAGWATSNHSYSIYGGPSPIVVGSLA